MSENGGSAAAGNPENGAGGAASGSWFETAVTEADLRGWAANKGFDKESDPSAAFAKAAKSYYNLEKIFGADKAGRTVSLPSNWDDPNETGALFDKLGRPKSPDEYELPKDAVDEDFAKAARTKFHELGLSAKQAKALGEWFDGVGKGRVEAAQQASAQQLQLEQEGLRKEWGAAHDAKIAQARAAAQALGVDAQVMEKLEGALGYSGLLKFFANVGARTGESRPLSEGNGGGVMTPSQARDRINGLMQDKDFSRRLTEGDLGAKTEWDRLHQMAYS